MPETRIPIFRPNSFVLAGLVQTTRRLYIPLMLPSSSSFSTAASAPKEVTRTCFDGDDDDNGDRWVLTKSHTPPNPQHACEENSRRSVKSSLIAHRTGSAMEWIGWAKRNKASVPIIISVVIVTVESSTSSLGVFCGCCHVVPQCIRHHRCKWGSNSFCGRSASTPHLAWWCKAGRW